jgi:FAD/FMN-containing dehydrogenase
MCRPSYGSRTSTGRHFGRLASIGHNFGYGGAAPRVRGSAVVDLGARVNKVPNSSEPQAFALVEPGVTFLSLYEEFHKRGMKLWIDSPDLCALGIPLIEAWDRPLR